MAGFKTLYQHFICQYHTITHCSNSISYFIFIAFFRIFISQYDSPLSIGVEDDTVVTLNRENFQEYFTPVWFKILHGEFVCNYTMI